MTPGGGDGDKDIRSRYYYKIYETILFEGSGLENTRIIFGTKTRPVWTGLENTSRNNGCFTEPTGHRMYDFPSSFPKDLDATNFCFYIYPGSAYVRIPSPSAVAHGVLKMLIACKKSYPQVDKRDWSDRTWYRP